jgi:methionine-rich copper-binding protein CopC
MSELASEPAGSGARASGVASRREATPRERRGGGSRRHGLARYVPAVVVTALILSIGLLATGVATRPVRLASAAPADLDRLGAAPAAVTLSFTARPDPARVHVAVVDPAGAAVTPAGPTLDGLSVVQPVSIVAAGSYRVGYHVGFADGRELSGLLTFTVASSGPAVAVEAPVGAHEHSTADLWTAGLFALVAAVVVVGLLVAAGRRPDPGRSALYELQECLECGSPDCGRCRTHRT